MVAENCARTIVPHACPPLSAADACSVTGARPRKTRLQLEKEAAAAAEAARKAAEALRAAEAAAALEAEEARKAVSGCDSGAVCAASPLAQT